MLERYYKLFKPRGPSLERAPVVELEFSGTRVRFQVPGYSYHLMPDTEEDRGRCFNLYDKESYTSLHKYNADSEKRHDPGADVPAFIAFKTTWSFFQGWLLKGQAFTLDFTLMVFHNPRHGSLFNPVHLEQAVVEYVDGEYGPFSKFGSNGRRFQGPLDWKAHHDEGRDWLHYRMDDLRSGGGDANTKWVVALSDEHFLEFDFRELSGNDILEQKRRAIGGFLDQIIASCEIEYSPDASRQREVAKEQWPDGRFSETLEPMAWLIYDEEPERFLSESDRDHLQYERDMIASNLKQGRRKYFNLARPTLDEKMDAQREKAKAIRGAMANEVGGSGR